jgi:hypothetical protein
MRIEAIDTLRLGPLEKEKNMESKTIAEAIDEAIKELEPTQDNLENSQEEAIDEDLVDLDSIEDNQEDDLDESDDSDITDSEEEDNETNDGESYIVKVDGEDYEVSIDELKSGYSRQAHYTKSMQALKEEKDAFYTEISQYQETLDQLNALDTAWESNPVSVLTNLLGSTENPSYFLGLVIKEAAANDLLTPEALEYFGIDSETKRSWSTETEMERLKQELAQKEDVERLRKEQETNKVYESKVQDAIQMYDNQITEIIAEEDLDLPSAKDRSDFKVTVLKYASENGILDLKKAYAAMTYELSRKKGTVVNPKKKATQVVSRKSTSGSSVSNVNNPKDLRSLIQDTMKDLNF